jgi:integrase
MSVPKKPFLFYPISGVPCYPLEGVPLEEVYKLLGHESIKTTEKSYAKWVQARQDRLDSLVIATWG